MPPSAPRFWGGSDDFYFSTLKAQRRSPTWRDFDQNRRTRAAQVGVPGSRDTLRYLENGRRQTGKTSRKPRKSTLSTLKALRRSPTWRDFDKNRCTRAAQAGVSVSRDTLRYLENGRRQTGKTNPKTPKMGTFNTKSATAQHHVARFRRFLHRYVRTRVGYPLPQTASR